MAQRAVPSNIQDTISEFSEIGPPTVEMGDEVGSTLARLREVIKEEAGLRKSLVQLLDMRERDAQEKLAQARRHLEDVRRERAETMTLVEEESLAAKTGQLASHDSFAEQVSGAEQHRPQEEPVQLASEHPHSVDGALPGDESGRIGAAGEEPIGYGPGLWPGMIPKATPETRRGYGPKRLYEKSSSGELDNLVRDVTGINAMEVVDADITKTEDSLRRGKKPDWMRRVQLMRNAELTLRSAQEEERRQRDERARLHDICKAKKMELSRVAAGLEKALVSMTAQKSQLAVTESLVVALEAQRNELEEDLERYAPSAI